MKFYKATIYMNKKIILLAICAFLQLALNAQSRKEKVESAHIAFISSKLDLDEATAEKFWPIYNRYTDELKTANKERKSFTDQLDNISLSDADADKNMNSLLAAQQKVLDVQKKYKAEFLRVLKPRQLAQLYVVERDFKEKLLQRMQGGAGTQELPNNRRPMRRMMGR
jgi:Spy/CpxP family protein refolding chaperone